MFFCVQHSIDDVENLIKKHEAFEKSAAAQEERFSALERLTTVSAAFVWVSLISRFLSKPATRDNNLIPFSCIFKCHYECLPFFMAATRAKASAV